jgi:hypothetical protein
MPVSMNSLMIARSRREAKSRPIASFDECRQLVGFRTGDGLLGEIGGFMFTVGDTSISTSSTQNWKNCRIAR